MYCYFLLHPHHRSGMNQAKWSGAVAHTIVQLLQRATKHTKKACVTQRFSTTISGVALYRPKESICTNLPVVVIYQFVLVVWFFFCIDVKKFLEWGLSYKFYKQCTHTFWGWICDAICSLIIDSKDGSPFKYFTALLKLCFFRDCGNKRTTWWRVSSV